MTSAQPPSWAVSVPSTAGVHTEPPSSTQWQNLTQDQVNTLRQNLLESILQVVVQLVTGGLLPGDAGTQLTNWATSLPVIGPLISSLTGGNVTSGLLTDLQSFFNFAPGTSNILSILESGAETLAQNVLDTLGNFLGGAGTGTTPSTLGTLLGKIPLIGNLVPALTGGNVPGSDGLDGLATFFNFSSGATNIMDLLSNAGADFVSLVKSFIPGYSGTDQATAQIDFGSIITNVMSMLGSINPLPGGTFDPIASASTMLQDVLTPAGALSTFTQIPTHLFGNLTVGSGAGSNVLPDPNFANPANFEGEGVWTQSSINRNGVGGSAQLIANGTPEQMIGIPFPTAPGQTTGFTAYVFWTGVIASAGYAFVLAANAYDANDNQISDPVNRILATISSPATNAGDGNYRTLSSWQELTGAYTAPAGTVYVRICMEVEAVVTAGTINFTGGVQLPSSLVDSSLLGNIENIPQLLGTSVGGAQGISDVVATFGHVVDGLGSAFGSALSGLSFSQLFGLAQSTAQNAATAQDTAQAVATTQAIVINQPASAGLEATVESNIKLTELGTGAAPSSITITQAVSRGSFVRLSQAKTLGFLQWRGYISSGTISGFYANFAKVDASGNFVPIFSSADLHTTLNTAEGWQLYDLSTLIGVEPGDEILVEFQVVGTGTYTIAGLGQSWMTSHPSSPTKQTSFTRNTGASGPTALSVAAGSISWNGNTPMIGLGVGTADIPVPVQASVPVQHMVHGTYTDTAPAWWRPGIDFLDRIAVGPGGGGDSGYGGAGAAGTNTTITVGGSTLTAAAAPGANSGGSFTSGQPNGLSPSPNPFVFNGVNYYGGAPVGAQQTGNSPGGGGGGGEASFGYTAYGEGASGGSWAAITSQPTATTVTSVVGTGGVGQSNFSAGSGADGGAWLVWRQNPAA